MLVGYKIAERFDPEDGEYWRKYIALSGLHHLEAVVGLDTHLNPSGVKAWTEEDG